MCSYLIVLNVQDYLKYEVVTSVYGVSEVPVKFRITYSINQLI